jgi:hypothetical protein
MAGGTQHAVAAVGHPSLGHADGARLSSPGDWAAGASRQCRVARLRLAS